MDNDLVELASKLNSITSNNQELFCNLAKELEGRQYAAVYDNLVRIYPSPDSNYPEIYVSPDGVYLDGDPKTPVSLSDFINILRSWIDYQSKISGDLKEILKYILELHSILK